MKREMKLRKKLVLKLPQASTKEKLFWGKRRGCISIVVRAVAVGVKTPNVSRIEPKREGLII